LDERELLTDETELDEITKLELLLLLERLLELFEELLTWLEIELDLDEDDRDLERRASSESLTDWLAVIELNTTALPDDV
jgi:hypothetical protein